jgi:hypothetical protein
MEVTWVTDDEILAILDWTPDEIREAVEQVEE